MKGIFDRICIGGVLYLRLRVVLRWVAVPNLADECEQILVGFAILRVMYVPLRTVVIPGAGAGSIS